MRKGRDFSETGEKTGEKKDFRKKLQQLFHHVYSRRLSLVSLGFAAIDERALSSVGLEHLPYKQGVGGSSPSAPTPPSPWELRFLGAFLFLGECCYIRPRAIHPFILVIYSVMLSPSKHLDHDRISTQKYLIQNPPTMTNNDSACQ